MWIVQEIYVNQLKIMYKKNGIDFQLLKFLKVI